MNILQYTSPYAYLYEYRPQLKRHMEYCNANPYEFSKIDKVKREVAKNK